MAADVVANQLEILNNIVKTLAPIQKLITGAAYLMGISFAFKAIYALKIYGESRTMMSNSASIKEPVFYLIVSAMFVYLPSGVSLIMNTTFGYTNILAYSGNQAGVFSPSGAFGKPLVMIVQVIGLIAFIKGWILVARSASQGQQPGGMGKGMVHVFGGIIAMNIVGTLEIINNTLFGTG